MITNAHLYYFLLSQYELILKVLAASLVSRVLVRRWQAAHANQAQNGLARVQIVAPPRFYRTIPRVVIRHFSARQLFRVYTGPMLIYVRNRRDLPYVLSLSYNVYSEIHFSAMSSSSPPVRLRALNQLAWPLRRNESFAFVSPVERNQRMLKAQSYRAEKRASLLQLHETYGPLDFYRKGNIGEIVDFQFGEFSFFDNPNYPSVSLNTALARRRMTAVRINPLVDRNRFLCLSLCAHQTSSLARSEQISLAHVILIVVVLAFFFTMLNRLLVIVKQVYSERL